MKTMLINMETTCYICRQYENNTYKYGDNMLYMWNIVELIWRQHVIYVEHRGTASV